MSDELRRWRDESDVRAAPPACYREAADAYRALGPSQAQLERMLSRLEPEATSSSGGTHSIGGKLGTLGVGVAILGGAMLGGLALRERSPELPPPAPAVVAPVPAVVAPAPEPPAQEVNEVAPPAVLPDRPRRPRAAKAAPVAASAPDPLAELSLLQRARRILPRDPARALALADEHGERFARGSFVEERELLAIESLLALGRRAEAEARATRFMRAHPQTVHAHRLSVLLEK